MFRLWGKIWTKNHLIKDTVICDNRKDVNRTRKIYGAIDEICNQFDLSRPLWLDSNIEEFKRHDKTRFRKDNFIDDIEFDFLEIQVIEEDEE